MIDKIPENTNYINDIKVEVRLFATLREHLPQENRGVKEFIISRETPIDALIDFIGDINKKNLILMVNGRRMKDFSLLLKDGDRVSLFPPVGGG